MALTVIVGPEFNNIIDEIQRLGDYEKDELMRFIALEALDVDIQTAFEQGKDPVTNEEWQVSKRAEREHGVYGTINIRHTNACSGRIRYSSILGLAGLIFNYCF